MIEISNEELSKVLNLWTETEEWESGSAGWLHWSNMAQRRADGSLVLPCHQDKEAHALVNFMLKERKYLGSMVMDVYYPEGNDAPGKYVGWVKDWEAEFGDKPQDDQPKVVDHSIPVRYDHVISTEELVKRAQERWPDDGWVVVSNEPISNVRDWGFGLGRGTSIRSYKGTTPEYIEFRAKLLTLIGEVKIPLQSDKMPLEPPLIEDTRTKAERFYAFLSTPQPDISPGLWGIVREVEPITIYSEEVCCQCLGMGKFDGVLCVKDDCKARL